MAYRSRQMQHTGGVADHTRSLDVRNVVKSSYLDQYEAARQSFVPQRGRGGRCPTPARRSYNTKRTEGMGISRGKESMKQKDQMPRLELISRK